MGMTFDQFYLTQVAGVSLSKMGMIPPEDDQNRTKLILENFRKAPELAQTTLSALAPQDTMLSGLR